MKSFGLGLVLASSQLLASTGAAKEKSNLRRNVMEDLPPPPWADYYYHSGYGNQHMGHYPPPPPPPMHHGDPYVKVPTERPTPVPTPNPTDRPTPYPTHGAVKHNPYSPHAPSTDAPSEFPTESYEPSEEPTETYEPSEEPTETFEPSENPTESPEPSDAATVSPEPTESPLFSIAEFVCLDEYEDWFSSLCDLITSLSPLFALLDESIFLDLSLLGGGGRKLQDMDTEEKRRLFTDELLLGEPSPLTLFAPTNDAIDRLIMTPLSTFYDGTDADVVDYFSDCCSLDVNSDTMGDYLLGPDDGATTMTLILLQHIIPGLVPAEDLTCSSVFNTFSGQPSNTECQSTQSLDNVLGVVGAGNAANGEVPLVYPNAFQLANGALSAVDRVILPELAILPDAHDHLYFLLPHHEDGIVILNSFLGVSPILFPAVPTPAPTPSPVSPGTPMVISISF